MSDVLIMHSGDATIIQIKGRIYKAAADLPVRKVEEFVSRKLKEGRK